MSKSTVSSHVHCKTPNGGVLACAVLGGIALGAVGTVLLAKHCKGARKPRYSIADQPLRFARDKAANNRRVLDIDSVFNAQKFESKAVLVTGGNRGLGLALVRELSALGARVYATVRKSNGELEALTNVTVIEGIDVTSEASMETLVAAVGDVKLDVLINNAGYFYGPVENMDTLNFREESLMIEICAIGALRVTAALWNAGKMVQDGSAKIAMITSQGGSIEWRSTQNVPGPDFGGNYGHHMSKAAANMMGKLASLELQGKAQVGILHPGFNRTDMTSKYSHIWDIEGAVDSCVGAKRVLHEINELSHASSGKFINCEDGLEIPW